jgi:uncharacterized protein (DUF488 family)
VVATGSLMTIGHSTHDVRTFLSLLVQNFVTAVADVRSVPHSRYTPQFNRKALDDCLRSAGIKYVFMGRQLGARTEDADCYIDGRVQYDRLAQTVHFNDGITRLLNGAKSERIAIMCAEQEPLACHRTILVSRILVDRRCTVDHIHGDGRVESHHMAMRRLTAKYGLDAADLFHTPDELVEEALDRQERRIAYVNEELRTGGT